MTVSYTHLDVYKRQPLVLVGGPLASLNPEIIAPFADIVFIGESEESLPDLLTACLLYTSRCV